MSPDESVHGTFECEATVLIIARTITSTTRLLEATRFFRDDFRVNLIFTVNDTSPFSSGVRALIREAGVGRIVPWNEVPHTPHALALSASENVDFDDLVTTTVVLPHGIGFNKYVPDPTTGGTRLAGLPPESALRSGKALLVLAHPAQERQLRQSCPAVEGNTAVTGDPTFEQLLACHRLREHYRRELGTDGRTLILLSSTWRDESAFGRWRKLANSVLASLPADEYQVVAAMHPNVWSWYDGEFQIGTWFHDAIQAGLLLLPPTRGWQAALVAADLVIGDHGSVTLYAAALGKPVLLAGFGAESVTDSPVGELGCTADHLDRQTDIHTQVRRCLADHDAERFAELGRQTFAHVGDSTRMLRDLLYAQLGLPVPADQELPLVRFPTPDPYRRRPTTFDVYTEFTGAEITDPEFTGADGTSTDTDVLLLRRHPRSAGVDAAEWHPSEPAEVPRHLAVEEGEEFLRRFEVASVLVRRSSTVDHEARGWVSSTRRAYPGSRLAAAATDTGCIAEIRNGPLVRVETDHAEIDTMILASALYACVLEGRAHDGTITVRSGLIKASMTLTTMDNG